MNTENLTKESASSNENEPNQVQVPDVNVNIGEAPPEEINEGEDEDRQQIVEQSLISANFHEATGFKLTHKWTPCCPSLDLDIIVGPTERSRSGFKMGNTAKKGCFCCFPPCSREWQDIKLFQGVTEVMNFIYKPEVWFGRLNGDRLVDIYIPQSNKRIGFLKYKEQLDQKGTIIDCVGKSAFTVSKHFTESSVIAITIKNQFGIPVAFAQSTKGTRYKGFTTWTGFELKFTPSLGVNLSVSERGVVLVAFMMWVIGYRERNTRTKLGFIILMIFVGIVIAVVAANST